MSACPCSPTTPRLDSPNLAQDVGGHAWNRARHALADALTCPAIARRGSGLSKALGALPLFSPPPRAMHGVVELADALDVLPGPTAIYRTRADVLPPAP